MENLEKGNLFWTQGWVSSGAPESAITGKKYRGINNLFPSLIAMSENYGDNRWATFKQMEEKGWTFKKDEEGNSLAKGNRIKKNASERIAIYNPIYDFREERRQYFCRKTICENRGLCRRNGYSEERIWLAKYRLNKSPRQGKDFPKTLLKITNEKNKISL